MPQCAARENRRDPGAVRAAARAALHLSVPLSIRCIDVCRHHPFRNQASSTASWPIRAPLHGGVTIANAANLSALVTTRCRRNWVGFYFTMARNWSSVSRPAGLRAHRLGRGVCGTAAQSGQRTMNAFADHIACDAASRSELVVPLFLGDQLLGVFDLDSPEPARFDADDEAGLAALAALYLESIG